MPCRALEGLGPPDANVINEGNEGVGLPTRAEGKRGGGRGSEEDSGGRGRWRRARAEAPGAGRAEARAGAGARGRLGFEEDVAAVEEVEEGGEDGGVGEGDEDGIG